VLTVVPVLQLVGWSVLARAEGDDIATGSAIAAAKAAALPTMMQTRKRRLPKLKTFTFSPILDVSGGAARNSLYPHSRRAPGNLLSVDLGALASAGIGRTVDPRQAAFRRPKTGVRTHGISAA